MLRVTRECWMGLTNQEWGVIIQRETEGDLAIRLKLTLSFSIPELN